ncbi:MAG TPA: hypothetical protein V6D18_13155 [Thermosynechococcaceae cyanobacterium]
MVDIGTIKELTESQQKLYQRLQELSKVARQRYLDAGGDPLRSSGDLHSNSHMTDAEKQEFLTLARQLSQSSESV